MRRHVFPSGTLLRPIESLAFYRSLTGEPDLPTIDGVGIDKTFTTFGGTAMLDSWIRDLAQTVRSLRRRPTFTLTASLTLGLGIGLSTAMFSIVDAVVLQPLPLEAPERLVWVWSTQPDQSNGPVRTSEADVVDWRQRQSTFDAIVAAHNRALTWLDGGEATKLSAVVTSLDFFSVLGPRFALGRGFDDDDEGRDAAILSHAAWQRHFAGDPSVLGRRLTLDGTDHTVVGVVAADFELPRDNVDVYLVRRLVEDRRRSLRSFFTLGRLADGVSIATARDELAALSTALAAEHPETNRGWSVELTPLQDHLVGEVRAPLWVLSGAVLALLLITCVNVASLVLARADTRIRELAVYRALGASRARILRRLLIESMALATLGGAIGWLVARIALPILVGLAPEVLPRIAEIGLDLRAFGFALVASLIAGSVAGLVPSWANRRRDLASSLANGARSTRPGIRGGLVVAEVALAVVLVLAAGLLARTFDALHRVDPGFTTDDLAVVRIFGRPGVLRGEAKSDYFSNLEGALADVPGVVGVGGATSIPFSAIGPNLDSPCLRAGDDVQRAVDAPVVAVRAVTPTFLPTLDVPLLRGRWSDARDHDESEPVALVNRALAEQIWPGEDPIGQRLRLRHGAWRERTVIALVGDLRQAGPATPPRPEVYLPHTQHEQWVGLAYAVRTAAGDGVPAPSLDTLRRAVLAFDPEQPPHTVTTMLAQRADQIAREQFAAVIASLLAALAVALAAIGLYGLIAATVESRRREVGVRMALGARRRQIVGRVIGRALALVALGLTIGSVGASVATRWLDALLFGVSPNDPATWAATCAVLTAAALIAASWPARQAAAVEPAEALRHE